MRLIYSKFSLAWLFMCIIQISAFALEIDKPISKYKETDKPLRTDRPRKVEGLPNPVKTKRKVTSIVMNPTLKKETIKLSTIPSKGVGIQPIPTTFEKIVGPDPFAFTILANKDSVSLGEELELTIKVNWVDFGVNNGVKFLPEWYKYTLKLAMPEGFRQTGGDYTDYCTKPVDAQNQEAVFTVRGIFEYPSEENVFKVLRGFEGAGIGSEFIFKGEKKVVISYQETIFFGNRTKYDKRSRMAGVCTILNPVKVEVKPSAIFGNKPYQEVKEGDNYLFNGVNTFDSLRITMPFTGNNVYFFRRKNQAGLSTTFTKIDSGIVIKTLPISTGTSPIGQVYTTTKDCDELSTQFSGFTFRFISKNCTDTLGSVSALANSPINVGQTLNLVSEYRNPANVVTSIPAGASLSWSKNGVNVPSTTITNVSASDTGNYVVKVAIGANCQISSTVNVSLVCTVPPVPSIIMGVSQSGSIADSIYFAVGQKIVLQNNNYCPGVLKWSNGATGYQVDVFPTVTTTYTAYCQDGNCRSANSSPVKVIASTNCSKIVIGKPYLYPNTKIFNVGDTLTLGIQSACTDYNSLTKWTDGTTIFNAGSKIVPTQTKNYLVRCENSGCVSSYDTLRVFVKCGNVTAPTVSYYNGGNSNFPIHYAQATGCTGTISWFTGDASNPKYLGKGSKFLMTNTPGYFFTNVPLYANCSSGGCSSNLSSGISSNNVPFTPAIDYPKTLNASILNKYPYGTVNFACGESGIINVSGCRNDKSKQIYIFTYDDINNTVSGKVTTYPFEGNSVEIPIPVNANSNPTRSLMYLECYATDKTNPTWISIANTVESNKNTPYKLPIKATNNTICTGGTSVLYGENCGGTIQWQSRATAGSWTNTVTGDTISVSPTVNSFYRAKCVSANCPSNPWSDSLSVNINGGLNAPTAPVIVGDTLINYALDDPWNPNGVAIRASCSGSIVWSTGQQGDLVYVRPSVTTSYTARCNSNGCLSQPSKPVVVNICSGLAPTITLSKDTVYWCGNRNVTITIAGCPNSIYVGYYYDETGRLLYSSYIDSVSTTYFASLTKIRVKCIPKVGNGCPSRLSDYKTIYFVGPPTPLVKSNGKNQYLGSASSGGGADYCDGESVVLNVENCTGTVKWYTRQQGTGYLIYAATGLSYSPPPVTFAPGETAKYFIDYSATCTINNCESSSGSFSYNVFKILAPTISTSSPTQICSGASITLTATGCNNLIMWNGVNGGQTITVNPVRDTTFTAKCRYDYVGCESPNSNTLSFTIKPTPPQLTISPTSITVCPSDSATLTASACTGYVQWSNGLNGQIIKVAPATTSTFTAKCVNSCGVGGIDSSPTTVTVTPLPKPVVTASQTLLCTNGSHANPNVTLTATGCGANTVRWSNNMTGASITFSPTVSKKYSAVCVRNTCVSAPADSIQLTVLSVPLPPSVTVSNRNKCVGVVRNDNVTAMGYNGGLKWYANGVLLTDTTSIITVSPTVTTKYYTTSTNVCGTSNPSPMDSIVLVPIPSITSIALLNKATPNVCANNPNDKLQLQANGCTGTVEWTGGELTGQNITGTTVLVKPTALTTYSARCNDRGCLSVYRNFQGSIFVERPLTMTVVNSPIAVGQSSRLKATYGYAQYRWFTTTNTTTPFATTTDSSVVVSPTVNTAYFVKCDGYCAELSTQPSPQSVLIDIPPTPTITAATNSICEGSNASVQLTVSGCATGTVLWDNGETGTTRIVTPLFTTTYSACCISSYGNAGATKGYKTITVTALPTITAYPVTAKVGEIIKLAVDVTPAGTYTYNWTGPNSFTSTQQNPQVTASAVKLTHQGIYTIRIGGASVCTAIATAKVTIQDAQCGCDDCATLVTTDPFNNPTVAITGKNYVVENTYLTAQTAIPSTAVAMMQTISYLDGLGRPIQSTAVKAGPNQEDIISVMEYDAFGREATKRLPFAAPSINGGKLIVSPADYIKDYYSKDPAKQADKDYAFAQTTFEASPLNRVLQQGSPGQAWQPTANATDATNHTVRMGYFTNTKAGAGADVESKLKNDFKSFTFPSIATTVEAQTVVVGIYDANQLMVNISTDENGNKVAEAKDKEGRVVCKRVQNANQLNVLEIAETNYAYDDFGLLRFVFQPKAAASLTASTTAITPLSAASTINELVFGYNYDVRFRQIEKKVPGMAKTEMVYDKRDRLVYTLDGWGRNVTATTGRSKGVYARYDELNRVIESGYYTVLANINCGTPAVNSSTNPRGYLQCAFDAATAPAYDFLATAAVADKVVLLNNVYDAYPAGDEAKFNLTHAYSQAKTSNVKGLLVKTIDKVVHNNVVAVAASILNNSVTTIMYYDNLGRGIQTNTLNHSNGTDIASTQLDFTGRTIASKNTTNYTWRPSSGATTALAPIVIENKTTYDYGGRVASVCQKNDADTWEPVVRNSYSKIGELLGKKMGCDIQNVDYQYNIRSWLTKINDPANLAGNNRDLFGLNLTYNDATQFNGNITKLEWNTLSKLDGVAVPKGLQQYTYTYDKMNRLQTANFSSSVTALNALGISVAMGNGTNSYDINGNILFMKRTVNSAVVDNLTYTYDKSGLSNRLLKIDDAGDKTNANYFVDVTNATDYTYDANGNMITDVNKVISSMVYNHANLPTLITNNSTGTNKGTMKYYYTFTGKKVRTEVIDGVATNPFTNAKTIEYINGLAFKSGALEFVPTAAGRALTAKYVWSNTTTATTTLTPPVAPANQYRYEYQLKDHLGDLRVSCRCGDPKRNAAGDLIAGLEPTMAVQENHYDPWGLGFADAASNTQKPPKNTDRFQYNGKEKVSDLGLNLMDYGARHYDAAIGRFISIDPHSYRYATSTPYNYVFNNPISNIDSDGKDGKVSGSGSQNDPYTISANYYYYGLNEKEIKALNNAISAYNNKGVAFKLKVGDQVVYLKFDLKTSAVTDKAEALKSIEKDSFESKDGSTGSFGNIVNSDFTNGDPTAYAHADNLGASINRNLLEEHTTKGIDNDGTKIVADYNKLLTSALTHELGHNLLGIHGDPGGLMDKVGFQTIEKQIGGNTNFINYPSITNKALSTWIMRIDKPYGTDYSKDNDYIQQLQNGGKPNPSDYGTTGKVNFEKK